MNFLHSDLGQVGAETVVEFGLNSRAFVRVMDSANFSAYRGGRRYTFYGGEAVQNPARVSVPQTGHWHAVVDLNGHAGTIRASINVLAPV